ncbi:hypothetical protein DERF_014303 [Dermatophagoides farinae]|uniref:Uncharacterized protein n=1 Tax=Dermatophagoides farinae TaxID=6954 RepID=A0A922HHG5_DERFA|nr:hypothetical protein DERF_014303 [Dermatophagoides farinae]
MSSTTSSRPPKSSKRTLGSTRYLCRKAACLTNVASMSRSILSSIVRDRLIDKLVDEIGVSASAGSLLLIAAAMKRQ